MVKTQFNRSFLTFIKEMPIQSDKSWFSKVFFLYAVTKFLRIYSKWKPNGDFLQKLRQPFSIRPPCFSEIPFTIVLWRHRHGMILRFISREVMQSIECNDVNWSTPKIHHVNMGIFPTDFAFFMWRICNLGLALTNQWSRTFQSWTFANMECR